MANAPVLKTGVRKDLGVRIPRPPLNLAQPGLRQPDAARRIWFGGPLDFALLGYAHGPTSFEPHRRVWCAGATATAL